MTKVILTVESDRYSSVSRIDEDEAGALAQCIFQIAETSNSDQVAAVAEAVHHVMRGQQR